ncbi:transposase domain-containing protein [Streptomyces sp. NPDC102270]|uniref:transposase domain-containing protein n=1 Tax=Streptomyces sp. NPDC102270 TaxID=3366150 RepID=UPI00380378F4
MRPEVPCRSSLPASDEVRHPSICIPPPGHLGELTQIVDPCLVDAVVAETAAQEQRLRLLPARVVVSSIIVHLCDVR